jgi:acid phosphatase
LENDFTKLVGNFSWNTVLECLSTARCNDLPLPDGVDEEMFTNVFREVENRQAIFLTWNESWYARTAMQPLMSELFDTINLALHDKPLSPKLAITMGHDSTLMPLLAAILRNNWDRKWTPYAGMAIFETYKTTGNSHAIRLLFKGKPQLIPGCADTLCDIESFRIAISFGRTRRNCTAPKEESLSASSETFFGLPRYWTYGTLIALAIFGAMMAVRYFRRHSNSSDEEKRGLLG